MKTIVFTVTNDLTYDQRMQRICSSLAANGYQIHLIGYKLQASIPLELLNYRQKRINCLFKKGKFFYLEYNFRLFFYLLFLKMDCICAIDLDTIIPCWMVSKIKRTKRVYDAHEYFTQLDEVISRPFIHKCWLWVERTFIPRFKKGYTVCKSIAEEFALIYKVDYIVIMNAPVKKEISDSPKNKRVILYQGAVNKGRGLEKMAEAMQFVEAELWICGTGNYMDQLKESVRQLGISSKIHFKGMLIPDELRRITASAHIAINPFESKGKNQFYSLSNKFFDYFHANIPQVTMNYPEYIAINNQFEVAILINDLDPGTIANAINRLLLDESLYQRLKLNCLKASEEYNWKNEEVKLLNFYKALFNE